MTAIDGFSRLGEEIGRRWEARNYDDETFAEIAAASLARSSVLESVALEDIADWMLSSRSLPPQAMRPFGQPPMICYRGRGFYIELLVWIDVPTAIHQHAFSGAFGVLRGSSFHSRYCFERAERICTELLLGNLTLDSAELLHRGDVRPIERGERFIHSLLHLEPPSISVVVRTSSDRQSSPQYCYAMPGLAVDPFFKPEPDTTQLALLEALARSAPELFHQQALRLVASRDLWFAFKVIELAARRGMESESFHELLLVLSARHPTLARVLEAVLREEQRVRAIVRHLKDVTDPDHRSLLALLINAPNRTAIDRLVGAAHPGADPERLILGWLQTLSERGQIGLRLDAVALRVLQFAMRGATFADLERPWCERFGDESLAAARLLWDQVHAARTLEPLLRTASTAPVGGALAEPAL
jgi:hypothetical protein